MRVASDVGLSVQVCFGAWPLSLAERACAVKRKPRLGCPRTRSRRQTVCCLGPQDLGDFVFFIFFLKVIYGLAPRP